MSIGTWNNDHLDIPAQNDLQQHIIMVVMFSATPAHTQFDLLHLEEPNGSMTEHPVGSWDNSSPSSLRFITMLAPGGRYRIRPRFKENRGDGSAPNPVTTSPTVIQSGSPDGTAVYAELFEWKFGSAQNGRENGMEEKAAITLVLVDNNVGAGMHDMLRMPPGM